MDITQISTKIEELSKTITEMKGKLDEAVSRTSDIERTKLNRNIDEDSKRIIREISGGSWTKITEYTTTGGETELTVSGLSNYANLMVIMDITGTSNIVVHGIRFNGDTGTNYNYDNVEVGIFKTQKTGKTKINLYDEGTSEGATQYQYSVANISNRATYKKMASIFTVIGDGGFQINTGGNWTNTTDLINSISLVTTAGTETYLAGSKITVYGAN